MKKKVILLLSLLPFLLVLPSCAKKAAPLSVVATDTEVESAYPVLPNPDGNLEISYPIADSESSITDSMRGPDFSIDEPVKAGDTSVLGTGPAGVPIVLVDVSLVGEPLAYTTIGEDGRFSFTLENPLPSGHSIGIQLGDLTGTDFLQSQFQYNETYFERPLIGTLFDMVSVRE